MRYSTESKYWKHVKGHAFLSFARKLDNKYGKKLMVTATKTGIVAAKTASKRDVEKTAEVTEGLVGNKIADKIKSAGKSKEDDKKIRRNFHSTRKKTTHNWWIEIVLAPYTNVIPKTCKFAWYDFWWQKFTEIYY